MDKGALFLGTYVGSLVMITIFAMQFMGNLFPHSIGLSIAAEFLTGILFGVYFHRLLILPVILSQG